MPILQHFKALHAAAPASRNECSNVPDDRSGRLRRAPGLALLAKALFRPFQHVLYGLAGVMPRDRRLWVFGSWSGIRFADNAAAMFRYSAAATNDSITCVWITRSRTICRDLRRQGYRAHLKWSPNGIWLSLRAGVYLFDGLTKDINHWTSRGARRVLLRHGVGIKKIERAIDQPGHRLYKLFHGRLWERLVWSFLIPWHRVRPDLVLASSEAHAEQAERFFDVSAGAVAVTGMPRVDDLLSPVRAVKVPQEISSWIESSRAEGRPLTLYIPTFRDDGASTFPYDWSRFDVRLAAIGVNVLVKPHPADVSFSNLSSGQYNHIMCVPSDVDPCGLLPEVDCLVTDYSSVAYDFMLFRKPIIFFCTDLEAYQRQSRSLDVPYEDVSPGWHAYSLEELCNALVAATGANADLGCARGTYEQVLDRFHKFTDHGACRRAHLEIVKRFIESAGARNGQATAMEELEQKL